MQSWTTQPNTTYWFAPGTHTFGTGQYASIDVANGDVFLGAPGAILSGQGHNDYAFTAHSSAPMTTPQNATIEYLTIENYMAGDGEMVVGQGGYDGWTIEYNTVKDNPQGAGIGLSTNGTVENNCTGENGEYGFSSLGGSTGIKFEYNDVYDNNNAGYYDIPGSTVQCGCSGGGKFWMTKNSAIDYNYVHGNIGTAIWADTDNAGLDISGNYITDNWSNGIAYEISYNGNITDNYLAGNDYGDVTTNDSPSFPAGAIFLNGSGDSTAVHSKYNGGTMYISGNVLVNNWGEITLFQDSNRVCGFSADGICTRPFGSPFNLSSCYAHLNGKTQAQAEAETPNYYAGCVWHMQNVTVSDNSISFDPSKLYTGPFAGTADTCASANSKDDTLCGYMGLFSYYGSIEAYPAATVSLATSNQQNNVFKTNTYVGPLGFSAFNQGDNVGWTQWSKGFVDSYSHDPFNPQDAGSSYTS